MGHHDKRRRSARAFALAVGLTLAVGLSACSNSTSGDSGAAAGTPAAPGGDMTFAVATPFYNLDPNVSPTAEDARAMRQIYDSLVAENPENHKITPWLAKSWSISKDGMSYTFHLRTGVTFQDGTTFDASAVCFNIKRILNPKTASLYARSLIAAVKTCKVLGPSTAQLQLSQPFGALLSYLAMPFLGMVSPAAVQKYGDQFANHPVGSGPFEYSSYTPNDSLVLTRNPDYKWAPSFEKHQGPAYLKKLTFQIVPEDNTRVGGVQSGSLDGVETIPGQNVAGLKANDTLTFTDIPESGAAYQLFMNEQHAPWGDVTARKALRAAMDVSSVVKALYFGVDKRAWGPLVSTTADYDASVENSFDHDPAAAGKMFDSLGWKMGAGGFRHKDGKTLSVTYIESTPDREKRQEIANLLKANMEKAGVKVTVKFNATTAALSVLQSGKYDLAGTSFINPTANIMFSLYDSQFIPKPGASGSNLGRIDDPKLDKMLVDAQQASDSDTQKTDYAKIQKYVIDNALSVGIYEPTYTVAVNSKYHGLEFDAESYPVFYDVSKS